MTIDVHPEHAHLQIGEVADRIGVTQRTLRFYEEKGLLKPPSRMEGRFRLYSEADIERVERIRQMQRLLGFSLAEIREFVEAEEIKGQIQAGWCRGAGTVERRQKILRVQDLTQKQRAMISQKLEQLQEMRCDLDTKLETYRSCLAQLDPDGASAPVAVEP